MLDGQSARCLGIVGQIGDADLDMLVQQFGALRAVGCGDDIAGVPAWEALICCMTLDPAGVMDHRSFESPVQAAYQNAFHK